MDVKEQINPCPVCGEKEALDVYHAWTTWHVMCGKCGYRGWRGCSPEEAVRLWNEN